jgi:hypothetical protein
MTRPPGGGAVDSMGPMNRTGIRNLVIMLALAALVFVSERTFLTVAISINQIITVLFLVAIVVFAYQYFRANELAWYVIPSWQRKVIIACGIGIAVLVLVGFQLLAPAITTLGVLALIGILAVVIVWIIRESRRFR